MPGSGLRSRERYHFAEVFPHYVVLGSHHIGPKEEKIVGIRFVVDDADTLFYDFDAFGVLRDWTFKDQVATAFPWNYKNAKFPKFSLGSEVLLTTTEGFVIFPQFRNIPERWQLPDGTTAINDWFKLHNIGATLSDAGRATQQIIQALDGFSGVRSLANAEIVELLNKVARRPASRSIHQEEFKGFWHRLRNANKEAYWIPKSREILVQRKAVELGLELRCTKCSSWSWHPLRQLDYQVACDRCLKSFDFPIADPSAPEAGRWSYRVIGPFALPDYARGGYAASLTIRFFADVIGRLDTDVTWSAGQELELAPGKKIEVDFVLWYQRRVTLLSSCTSTCRPTQNGAT